MAQLQACSSKSGKDKQKAKKFFKVAFVLSCALASQGTTCFLMVERLEYFWVLPGLCFTASQVRLAANPPPAVNPPD